MKISADVYLRGIVALLAPTKRPRARKSARGRVGDQDCRIYRADSTSSLLGLATSPPQITAPEFPSWGTETCMMREHADVWN